MIRWEEMVQTRKHEGVERPHHHRVHRNRNHIRKYLSDIMRGTPHGIFTQITARKMTQTIPE